MRFDASFSYDEEKNALVNDEGLFLELGFDPLADPKEEKRFIKATETLVRRSPEYRWWLEFVKGTLGLDWDLFTGETHEETKAVELHHHPLTLFDVVQAVLYKHAEEKGQTTSFDVAKEVIELHYKMRVGFVPLLKNLHAKFHNGFLKIPMEFVFGDWTYVPRNYPLPAETLEKLKLYASISLKDLEDDPSLWYPGVNPELRERFLKERFERAMDLRKKLQDALEQKGV